MILVTDGTSCGYVNGAGGVDVNITEPRSDGAGGMDVNRSDGAAMGVNLPVP